MMAVAASGRHAAASIVQFVGAGPGAADLMTVRASRLLGEAEVVLFPGTYLDPEVLGLVGPGARLIDTQGLDLNQITDHLVRSARDGLSVVRLTSGDPSVYSALAEQTRRLDAAGVRWQVTPGVAAYAAAAAVIGHELTVPEVAQSVVLTRVQARSTKMPETESLSAFAQTRATLAIHLAITRIGTVMEELAAHYGEDCPVAVVYRASQPEEAVLRGTVSSIADQVATAGWRQAAVILVGRALQASTLDGEECAESHLYDPARDR